VLIAGQPEASNVHDESVSSRSDANTQRIGIPSPHSCSHRSLRLDRVCSFFSTFLSHRLTLRATNSSSTSGSDRRARSCRVPSLSVRVRHSSRPSALWRGSRQAARKHSQSSRERCRLISAKAPSGKDRRTKRPAPKVSRGWPERGLQACTQARARVQCLQCLQACICKSTDRCVYVPTVWASSA
jgi:hypothetical protein